LGLSAGAPVCTLYITGSDAKLNVASLSLSHLAGVRFITIDIPPGATFVGNFAKLRSTTLSGVEVRLVRSYSLDRIFWNLPVSEKLAFAQTKFLGTVVSPQADVGICGNEGAGAFWAESVQASNSVW
jgi:choice-of-anchor A domain-containing protein